MKSEAKKKSSRVLIAVPSFNRPYDIMKRTGKWLVGVKEVDWVVCVEPQQYRYYAQSFPANRIIQSSNNCLMTGQLIRISEYAKDQGYAWVFKCDDDTLMKAWQNNRWSGVKNMAEAVEREIVKLVGILEQLEDVGGVSFPTKWRECLDMSTKASRQDFNFCALNRKFDSTYMIRTDIMEKFALLGREAWVAEDFLMSLLVRKEGLNTLIYWKLQQDHLSVSNGGGIQSHTTIESRLKLAKKVREDVAKKLGVDCRTEEKVLKDGKVIKISASNLLPDVRLNAMSKYNQV